MDMSGLCEADAATTTKNAAVLGLETGKKRLWPLTFSKRLRILGFVGLSNINLFFLAAVMVCPIYADAWYQKDNRVKGKTQQSHPYEPQDFFVSKTAKV